MLETLLHKGERKEKKLKISQPMASDGIIWIDVAGHRHGPWVGIAAHCMQQRWRGVRAEVQIPAMEGHISAQVQPCYSVLGKK